MTPAQPIQKRTDALVKHLRLIRDGKEKKLIFAEGSNLLEELLKSKLKIRSVFCLRETEAKVRKVLNKYQPADFPPIHLLAPSVMEFVSDLTTPPGIVTTAERPLALKNDLPSSGNPLILILNGLQLPQNVGALVRTAEAAGVTEIWLTANCADLFNPKALRASAGSAFRVPYRTFANLSSATQILSSAGINVFGASQSGLLTYDEVDWTVGTALAVSREGSGFSALEMKELKNTVKIPMRGMVESLNVGIAAGICLFEASMQRRRKSSPLQKQGSSF